MIAANVASRDPGDTSPVILRGTSRGLELWIKSEVSTDELARSIRTKLGECPGFFVGGDITLRFDEQPPKGCLAPIEQVTAGFGLRIVGVCHGSEEALVNSERSAPTAASTESLAESDCESDSTLAQDPSSSASENGQVSPPQDEAASEAIVTRHIRSNRG